MSEEKNITTNTLNDINEGEKGIRKLPTNKRNILLAMVTLAYFMVWFDENTFSASAPFWTAYFNLDQNDYAQVASAYLIGYFPTLFIAGILSDTIGGRKSLMIAVLGTGILSFLMLFCNTVPFMFIRHVLFGVCFGFCFAPCNKLLTDWTNPKERTFKVSIWNTCSGFSGMVASPFGLMVSAHLKWQYCFIGVTAISIVAFILFIPWLKDRPEDMRGISQEEIDYIHERTEEEKAAEALAKEAGKFSFKTLGQELKRKEVWLMVVLIGTTIGPTYLTASWGTMFAINGMHMSPDFVSFLAVPFGFTAFVATLLVPLLLKAFKYHIKRMILLALIISSISYILVGYADFLPNPLRYWLVVGGATLVNPWGWSSFNSYWSKVCKPNVIGAVNGAGAASCTLIGYILMTRSGVLITDMMSTSGYRTLWMLAGGIMALSIIFLIPCKKVVMANEG